jgi:LmbE family N-acetylglucosaminyl deacetylase
VTLVAGRPASSRDVTEWDAACGFDEHDDVVAARRAEDAAALALLGASPIWLDFLDAQYAAAPPAAAPSPADLAVPHPDLGAGLPAGGPRCAGWEWTRDAEAIAAAIARVKAESGASEVCIPLGLFHEDHELASCGALLAARRLPGRCWLVYADALYRRVPMLLTQRLATLRGEGWRLVPLRPSTIPASHVKRRAIGCYASQLRGLASPGRSGYEDALAPERYWQLTPAADASPDVPESAGR